MSELIIQEVTSERTIVDRQIEHFQNIINKNVDRDQKCKEDKYKIRACHKEYDMADDSSPGN
eukprot:14153484-Heterocapsa_arctica.AAC.1